jgi:predicted adenylyl cyclase CyaB
MCTEIEAKLKVESCKQITAKLTELGAEFLEERLQKDYYFDDAKSAFRKTDRCLRLRWQKVSRQEKIFLTYKGPKQKDNFKKRQQVEVEVVDGDSMEKVLSALGYQRVLAFEKRRQIWQLGECEVALDSLPLLGNFVEIEGPDDEKIADVQRKLGLSDLPHIKDSYAYLMEGKLRQVGKKEKQVFWESQSQ